MKTFKEFLAEASYTLHEMAFPKEKVEIKISEYSKQVVKHLVKVIVDPNNISSKHWIKEIYNWCDDVSDFKFKHNNRHPSKEEIESWLFDTTIDKNEKDRFKNKINNNIILYNLNVKYSDKMWEQYLDIRSDLSKIISTGVIKLADVHRIFEKYLDIDRS